jgi:hypothetical protein
MFLPMFAAADTVQHNNNLMLAARKAECCTCRQNDMYGCANAAVISTCVIAQLSPCCSFANGDYCLLITGGRQLSPGCAALAIPPSLGDVWQLQVWQTCRSSRQHSCATLPRYSR